MVTCVGDQPTLRRHERTLKEDSSTMTEADEVAGTTFLAKWRVAIFFIVSVVAACGLATAVAFMLEENRRQTTDLAGAGSMVDATRVGMVIGMVEKKTQASSAAPSPAVPSLAIGANRGVSGTTSSFDMGCRNWRGATLGPSTMKPNADACVNRCRDVPGCQAAMYLKDHKDEQFTSCHIFGESCEQVPNKSWDLYMVPEIARKETSPGFQSKANPRHQRSCSNLAQIQREPATQAWSIFYCKTKCQTDKDCTGILYQPDSCSGTGALSANSCYLLYGVCQEVQNYCWDYYQKNPNGGSTVRKHVLEFALERHDDRQSTTFLKQKTGKKNNKIMVEEDIFKEGDKVMICSEGKEDNVTIDTVGDEYGVYWTRESLQHEHPLRSPVARRPKNGELPNACYEFKDPTSTTTTVTSKGTYTTYTDTTTTTTPPKEPGFKLTRAADGRTIWVDRPECFIVNEKIRIHLSTTLLTRKIERIDELSATEGVLLLGESITISEDAVEKAEIKRISPDGKESDQCGR